MHANALHFCCCLDSNVIDYKPLNWQLPFPLYMLVPIQTLKVSSQMNFLSRAWWYPIFYFFEKNVQGSVPCSFSWPISWPPSCFKSSCKKYSRVQKTGEDNEKSTWRKEGKHLLWFFLVLIFLFFFYQNINAVTKVLKRTVTEEVDQASVQLIGKTIVDSYIAISDVFLSSGCTDLFYSSVLMKCTTDRIFLLKKKWSRTLLY